MNPIDILKEPSSDNQLWKIVEILLPTSQPTILTQAIFVIATVLLSTAILKIAYLIITFIVAAARNGTKVTDSFNVVFGPLSVIFAIGLMAPIPGGSGITSAHYILRNLIAAPSINMFDAISLAVAEHVIKDGKQLYPLAMHGNELAYSVFAYDMCTQLYNHEVQASRSPSLLPISSALTAGEVVELKNGTKKSAWDWSPQCGGFSLSYPLADEFGLFGFDRHKAVTKLIEDVRAITPKMSEGFFKALWAPPQKHDLKFVENLKSSEYLPTNFFVQIDEIAKEYEKTLQESASKQLQISQGEQRQKLIDGIKKAGGTVMFAYYTTLTRMNEQANGFTTEAPIFAPPKPEAWSALEYNLKNLTTLLDAFKKNEERQALTGDDFAFATEQDTSLFAKVVNSVSAPIVDYLTRYDGWSNDPTSDLINLGSRMMTSAKIGFGVGLTATGASNFWSSTAGKVVDYIMTGVWPLLAALFVGGAALAIVLPNLPLIYAIFGIVAFAVELLVVSGAILWWGFTHARLDSSDSFVSTANMPGYKFLFSLMFRPSMNMLAWLGAGLLSTVLLNILLYLWSFGFRANMGGASLGITSMIFSIGIVTYMQFRVVLYVFSLNMTLHERIAAWFGHVTQGMGEGSAANTIIATSGQNMRLGADHKPNNAPGNRQKPKNGEGGGGGGRMNRMPIPDKRNTATE